MGRLHREAAQKPKDHTANLIPARRSEFFRWADADAGAPQKIVESESTSDNPKKGEEACNFYY